MQHIETVTVGSGGAASITFSAIAQDFTDLLLLFSLRADANNVDGEILVNGSAGTARRLYGSGGGVASDAPARITYLTTPSAATANTFGNGSAYFPNYTLAVAHSVSIDSVGENNGATAFQNLSGNLTTSTAAITSITIQGIAGVGLAEFSSASLYGITAGSDGIVAVS